MLGSGGNTKVYSSLWPLPGGDRYHFATLLEILKWICEQLHPTKTALYSWVQNHYALGKQAKTTDRYVGLVARMGYIASNRQGSIWVTERGHKLLETAEPNMVLDALMREWLGVYEVLEMVSQLGAANSDVLLQKLGKRFSTWTSKGPYDWRLKWLYSLGCLEKSEGEYIITPMGRKAIEKFKTQYAGLQVAGTSAELIRSTPRQSQILESDETYDTSQEELPAETPIEAEQLRVAVIRDEADRLADQISAAALESDDATGFERVLVDAFRFLGFEAEHKSGPGDTDVLVTAALGQETYRSVVDGKSSRHGRVGKQQIDWLALDKHKTLHKADYILVVAPGFSSGDLLDNAAKTHTALVTSDDLAAIVRLHGTTPLSLADLREVFRYAGQPELPLQRVQEKAAEVARLQRLLPDILRMFERSHLVGPSGPISADSLQLVLALDYGRAVYSKDEIVAALDLLCTQLIGALRKVTETAYALQMPMTSVGRRFQAQARQLMEAAQTQPASNKQSSTLRSI